MEEITLTGATEGDEASRREKFKGTAVYKALQKFEAREVAAHDVIAALQDESCLPDASLTIHHQRPGKSRNQNKVGHFQI